MTISGAYLLNVLFGGDMQKTQEGLVVLPGIWLW